MKKKFGAKKEAMLSGSALRGFVYGGTSLGISWVLLVL